MHTPSSTTDKRFDRLTNRLMHDKYPQFIPWKYSLSTKSLPTMNRTTTDQVGSIGRKTNSYRVTNKHDPNGNENDLCSYSSDNRLVLPPMDHRLSMIAYNALRPTVRDCSLRVASSSKTNKNHTPSLLPFTFDHTHPVLRTGRATLLVNNHDTSMDDIPDSRNDKKKNKNGISNGIYYTLLPVELTNYPVHPLSTKDYAVPLSNFRPSDTRNMLPLPIPLSTPVNDTSGNDDILPSKINLHSIMLPPLPSKERNPFSKTTNFSPKMYGDRVLFTPPIHRTLIDRETITLNTSRVIVDRNDETLGSLSVPSSSSPLTSLSSISSVLSLDDQLTSMQHQHLFDPAGPDFYPGHVSSYSIMTDVSLVSPTAPLERIIKETTPLKIKEYNASLSTPTADVDNSDDPSILEELAKQYSVLWKHAIPPPTSLVVIAKDHRSAAMKDIDNITQHTENNDNVTNDNAWKGNTPTETTINLLIQKPNPLKEFIRHTDGNTNQYQTAKSFVRKQTFPPLLSAPVLLHKH